MLDNKLNTGKPSGIENCIASLDTYFIQSSVGLAICMLKSPIWGSHRCLLQWKIAKSKAGRAYLQLAICLKKDESHRFKLLPTPMASDGTRGRQRILTVTENGVANISVKGVRYGISLDQLARAGLLPTPIARSSDDNCSVNRGKANLSDYLAASLAPSQVPTRVSAQFIAEMMGFPVTWPIQPYLS